MSLKVKVKKLNDKAVIPSYAKDGDAGMDLVATSFKAELEGGAPSFIYGTSLSFEIPEGYVGLVFPRSSVGTKTSLSLSNAVGVIDSGYRGEVIARFRNIAQIGAKPYKVGEKICQIIIVPYPKIELEEVTELSNTERGEGGFGSSGT